MKTDLLVANGEYSKESIKVAFYSNSGKMWQELENINYLSHLCAAYWGKEITLNFSDISHGIVELKKYMLSYSYEGNDEDIDRFMRISRDKLKNINGVIDSILKDLSEKTS